MAVAEEEEGPAALPPSASAPPPPPAQPPPPSAPSAPSAPPPPPDGAAETARIGIFLRLRPVPRPSGRIVANAEEGWVDFNVPKDAAQGLINNSRESYRFPFDGLLPPDTGQGEVFDRVALPVLRAALDGYNGTVFAFGQTGSGKTFTITGGTERYADRGMIPRAISALFAEAGRRSDHSYTVHVSYLEIYNETGFDLLEPSREVRALEDLPKVSIQEDEEGRMHTRNLSLHRCDIEEQALNMLFLGDTNRVVAETPLNQASSRSHAVFTLHLEARRGDEARRRRSKLHFVDLAGSERVGKTGLAAHTQLKEAKYINLSLHFLEQVIISLQEGRPHIPYRNSVLTMVLRDSLGGNTRTVMVAAVAPEAAHVEESISTCRFAQRVAMISNRVAVNEEVDLEVVVRQLRRENALLRQELLLLQGDSGGTATSDATGGAAAASAAQLRTALTEAETHLLRRRVQAFVENASPDAELGVEASWVFIRAAFDMLKGMARGGAAAAAEQPSAAQQGGGSSGAQATPEAAAELRSLRALVQQQEQQIGVLSGVLRKQGLAPNGTGGPVEGLAAGPPPSRPSSSGNAGAAGGGQAGGAQQAAAVPFTDDVLADQHKAFEYFCATSPAHDAVAEHKAVLRGRYEAARALGSRVAAAKQRITELKSGVAQRRLARSMAALLHRQQGGREQGNEEQAADAEEQAAVAAIEREKAAYRQAYDQLREAKAEIDGMQAALERSRDRLQADFRAWFEAMRVSAATGPAQAHTQQAVAGQLARPAAQKVSPVLAAHETQPHDWQIPDAGAGSRRSSAALAPLPAPEAAQPSFASWGADASIKRDPQPAARKGSSSINLAGTSLGSGADTSAQPQQEPQQQPAVAQLPAVSEDIYEGVDPQVLAAAKPLLTGNPQADADILRFYAARHQLLRGMR